MSTVETVRGPVDVSELGRTLMHEHVFVLQPGALQSYGHVWGEYWDEDARVADAIEKLRAVRAAGIETIVDATAPPAFANERPDYLHMSTKVLPALRQAGVTDDQIDELMVANPRRFFDVG